MYKQRQKPIKGAREGDEDWACHTTLVSSTFLSTALMYNSTTCSPVIGREAGWNYFHTGGCSTTSGPPYRLTISWTLPQVMGVYPYQLSYAMVLPCDQDCCF